MTLLAGQSAYLVRFTRPQSLVGELVGASGRVRAAARLP